MKIKHFFQYPNSPILNDFNDFIDFNGFNDFNGILVVDK